MHKTELKTAWVPETGDMPWDGAVVPAIEWTKRQSAEQESKALVVTYARQNLDAAPTALRQFAGLHTATTANSRQHVDGQGPVLAYVPDYKTMEIATRYARNSSLCVVESSLTPLVGWAIEMGAVDLLTGSVTPETRSQQLKKDLERLVFYGNNGWGDRFGKQQAQRILADINSRGELDSAIILGHMLAHGASPRALQSLETLMKRI